MARKTSSVPTRIWKFGIPFGPEESSREIVSDQIRLGRMYRNALIELERERFARFKAARQRICKKFGALECAYDEIEAKIEAVYSEIRDHRRRYAAKRISGARDATGDRERVTRSMLTREAPEHLKQALSELKEQSKEALDALKAERPATKKNARLQKESKRINDEFYAKWRDVRKSDLSPYWGTYLLIEDAFKRSCQDSAKSGEPPRFDAWDQVLCAKTGVNVGGAGRIGVQIASPNNMTTEQLLECKDSRLRLKLGREIGSRGAREALLSIRVGSEGRAPVFAHFKVKVHRRLPPGAKIKWAWVQRRKISMHKFKWELCLALESEAFISPVRIPSHSCAINFGWLRTDEGSVKVAHVVGTDGHEEAIEVPGMVSFKLDYARGCRRVRDQNLDDLKSTEMKQWFEALDDEWKDEIQRVARQIDGKNKKSDWTRWRNPKKFAMLAYRMRADNGSGEIVEALLNWAKRDRHVGDIEEGIRSKAIGSRKEHYRLVAKRIAQRYSTIVLDGTNIKELAKKPKSGEEENTAERASRALRVLASPYSLKDAIYLMADKHGSRVLVSKGGAATKTCHVCGKKQKGEVAKSHVCESCGAEWDRDFNHCRNLLSFHLADAAE